MLNLLLGFKYLILPLSNVYFTASQLSNGRYQFLGMPESPHPIQSLWLPPYSMSLAPTPRTGSLMLCTVTMIDL